MSGESRACEGDEGTSHFLYVGRLVEEKGLPLLLDAMRQLAPGETIFLTVRGEGKLRDQTFAAASGMKGMLRYEGAVTEPFADASKFLALCFPSLALEGLPYVVLEAYAAGIPVISHDLDVLRDVVVEGETGLLVDKRTPEGWAAAMRSAAAHTCRTRELGARGRERIRQCYRLDEMVSRTAEVYDRLKNSEPDE
jgi:glycosyltransferase involved in cell wall biosynthesis